MVIFLMMVYEAFRISRKALPRDQDNCIGGRFRGIGAIPLQRKYGVRLDVLFPAQ
jgi:hypothetical protein